MFILCPPNTTHDERHIGQSTIMAIGFCLNDDEMKFSDYIVSNDISIFNLFNFIRLEIRNKQYGYNDIIHNYLFVILTKLMRIKNPLQSYEFNINYVIKYIDEYFVTDINIDDLANIAGYSTDHFRILYKNKTGISPKKYILQKRLNYATKLLQTSDMSVAEISDVCGFKYPPQFIQFFKQHKKCTPHNFRIKNKIQDII